MADIILKATITSDRRLVLTDELPPDVPVGDVSILILHPVIVDAAPATIGEILESPMIGLWKDRDDIGDSAEYVSRVRREAEERRNPWRLRE
ncbi:MAG: hypothetical protein JXB47_17945 [Anaerolineae bacterium]|nr:hypothetical protein [Anaerolineae bacterium]